MKGGLLVLIVGVFCSAAVVADDDNTKEENQKEKEFLLGVSFHSGLPPAKEVTSVGIVIRIVNTGKQPLTIATPDAKWWDFIRFKVARLVKVEEGEEIPPDTETTVGIGSVTYKYCEVPEDVFEFERTKIFPQRNLSNVIIYPYPYQSEEHSDFMEITWLVKTPEPEQVEDGNYAFKVEVDWDLLSQSLPDLSKDNFVVSEWDFERIEEWSSDVEYKNSPSDIYSHDVLVRLMGYLDDDVTAPKLYQEALRINPNSSYARMALGRAYQRLGNKEKLLQLFQEARYLIENHLDPLIPEDSELGKKKFYDGIRHDFCYSWDLYNVIRQIAGIYELLEDYQKAIDTYLEAIDVLRTSPVIGEGEIPDRNRWEIEAKIKELRKKLNP